jgi:hypothetical protein
MVMALSTAGELPKPCTHTVHRCFMRCKGMKVHGMEMYSTVQETMQKEEAHLFSKALLPHGVRVPCLLVRGIPYHSIRNFLPRIHMS